MGRNLQLISGRPRIGNRTVKIVVPRWVTVNRPDAGILVMVTRRFSMLYLTIMTRKIGTIGMIALVALLACTSAEWTTVTNAGGQVCEIVFTALDPALGPPICTSLVEVEQAIQALVTSGNSDAGAVGAHLHYGDTLTLAQNGQVYKLLTVNGKYGTATHTK